MGNDFIILVVKFLRIILMMYIFSCRWARRGDVWEASDLIQQMKEEGVQPDIHTYTSFINACCKAGDMLVYIP